ncbi:hypothetical protein F2Q70_00001511 [Brassica cretica]|uniref:Uncharacterized protein n=1 Tax=Brassica cretica TaxID=69181 RepID=A0A8S9J0X1_BRACR|nr:hypothetical protein F2Q70_00001511 [Brassica cretica]
MDSVKIDSVAPTNQFGYVFDFSTNAWRYGTPASPCEITDELPPVYEYVEGSLHWFTKCEET